MAQILVRGLDEKVVSRLKKRAKRNGRSLQSEARLALEQAARQEEAEAPLQGAKLIELLRAMQMANANSNGPDAAEEIRLEREERERRLDSR